MAVVALEGLRPAQPRRFVPAACSGGEWNQIEPLFEKLVAAAAQIKSPADLEQWILDGGELSAVLRQEEAIRYINMTCHTDEPEIEKAYLYFVEQIDPKAYPEYLVSLPPAA